MKRETIQKILTGWIGFSICIVICCGIGITGSMIDLNEMCEEQNGTVTCTTCVNTDGLEGLGAEGLSEEEKEQCGCHCYLEDGTDYYSTWSLR